MRLPRLTTVWIASLLLAATPLFAQQTGTPADGGTTEILQSIYIPPLAHAPFSLTLHTEWERPLANDDTITVVNHRRIARDADGRIFQERRLLVPPRAGSLHDGSQDSPLSMLQYADPVNHTLYNCEPHTHVCHLYRWNERPNARPGVEDGSTVFPGRVTERKELGTVMREGVEVHGAHIVTTFQPGAIGNKKPLVVEREFLYSDALGINLVSIRKDPRVGKQTFIVSDLSRDLPEASLFLPPPEYSIIDERASAPR